MKQMRLAYLPPPTSPSPTCYTSPVSGGAAAATAAAVSRQTKVSASISLSGAGGEDEGAEEELSSHGHIMNKFTKKELFPAVPSCSGDASPCRPPRTPIIVRMKAMHIPCSFPSFPLLAASCAPLFAQAKKLLQ